VTANTREFLMTSRNALTCPTCKVKMQSEIKKERHENCITVSLDSSEIGTNVLRIKKIHSKSQWTKNRCFLFLGRMTRTVFCDNKQEFSISVPVIRHTDLESIV